MVLSLWWQSAPITDDGTTVPGTELTAETLSHIWSTLPNTFGRNAHKKNSYAELERCLSPTERWSQTEEDRRLCWLMGNALLWETTALTEKKTVYKTQWNEEDFLNHLLILYVNGDGLGIGFFGWWDSRQHFLEEHRRPFIFSQPSTTFWILIWPSLWFIFITINL